MLIFDIFKPKDVTDVNEHHSLATIKARQMATFKICLQGITIYILQNDTAFMLKDENP